MLVALALAAAWLWASGLAGGSPAQAAQGDKGEFQLDLIVSLPPGTTIGGMVDNIGSSGQDGVRGGGGTFVVDSFFDVSYVSNIGSSGEDGVRVSEFNVDSFFDVSYEIDRTSDGGRFDTEMISMQLTGTMGPDTNPGDVLDAVRRAVAGDKGGVFYGHVTVMR